MFMLSAFFPCHWFYSFRSSVYFGVSSLCRSCCCCCYYAAKVSLCLKATSVKLGEFFPEFPKEVWECQESCLHPLAEKNRENSVLVKS